MPESGKQSQKKSPENQHGRHPDNKKNDKKAKNNKKNNDDDDRSGGLLEPIIEDLQGWIKRRRPIPS